MKLHYAQEWDTRSDDAMRLQIQDRDFYPNTQNCSRNSGQLRNSGRGIKDTSCMFRFCSSVYSLKVEGRQPAFMVFNYETVGNTVIT